MAHDHLCNYNKGWSAKGGNIVRLVCSSSCLWLHSNKWLVGLKKYIYFWYIIYDVEVFMAGTECKHLPIFFGKIDDIRSKTVTKKKNQNC